MSLSTYAKLALLLIDNDPAVYESLLWVEGFADYDLFFFSSAVELMTALQQRVPSCLIIEANLKPVGGIELYKKLIKDNLAPPTVFIATIGLVAQAVEAMQLGAVDYIEKPFIHSRLVTSIRKASESIWWLV